MTWRENLHLEGRGSFRRAEFFVDSADSSVGRTSVVHRFPGRDFPKVEDLNRAPREFKLVCYVLGEEYHVARDKLRVEFEKLGSGQLVHPYWGEFKVAVTSPVRIRETVQEGGLARFDLDVVEVTDSKITIATVDKEPDVAIKADAALDEAKTELESTFNLTGAIESVRTAAVSVIQTATQNIRSARAPANAAINLVDDVGSAIDDLESQAATLVTAPGALADSIKDVLAKVMGGLAKLEQVTADLIAAGQKGVEAVDGSVFFDDFRAERALEVFVKLTENGDALQTVQDTGSTQSDIEIANQAALVRIYQVTGAIESARAFSIFAFDSRDKAIEIRDVVATELDALAEVSEDNLYGKLVDLRASLTTHLSEVATALPDILDVTLPVTQPSLVLAYDLYGSIALEGDLIARNNVANPMQVPGSVVLKVVANG